MTNANIPLHVIFVEAWVRKGDKYLLAKRSLKDDQAAGKWAVPGGKEVNNFQFLTSRSFIRSSGHHVVALSFVADYKSGTAMPLEDQDEIKWVTLEEMKSLLDEHWNDILISLKQAELKD